MDMPHATHDSVLAFDPSNLSRDSSEFAPAWFRALTLSERSRLAERPCSESRRHADDQSVAHRRFEKWRHQPPFDLPGELVRRLQTENIDEKTLRELLNESDESLAARCDARPDWFVAVRDAWGAHAPPADYDAHDWQSFLNLVRPVILPGFRKLENALDALESHYKQLPFNRESLVNQLLDQLGHRLLRILGPTLILELNVARLEERLQGATPAERFGHFVRQLLDRDTARSLIGEYPVLARLAAEAVQHWQSASVELLTRLCHDMPQLQRQFSADEPLGDVVHVDGLAGDVHRRGRAVAIVRFETGRQIVYKPRSMAVELHFQELLTWLNQRGATPAFRTLNVLDCGSHGWAEFVEQSDCDSTEQLGRFYERLGALAAIFYVLEATDFHSENLIAADEHPLPIDLETLFQPVAAPNSQEPLRATYGTALARSVLMSGLLPRISWRNGTSDGVDISGIGGRGGELAPDSLRRWTNAHTDEMSIARETVALPPDRNVPRLNGRPAEPAEFVGEIERGFVATYRLLITHRDELLAEDGPLARFVHDEVRVILRESRTYAILLRESYHPDLLRDALDRDLHFDRLWTRTVREPSLARIVPFERRDLEQGDIPIFTTSVDSPHLRSSDGCELADYFIQTGFDAVRDRVRRLDDDDLARQRWLLRSSLGTLTRVADSPRATHNGFAGTFSNTERTDGTDNTENTGRPVNENVAASRGCFQSEAERIAEMLSAGAVRAGGRLIWTGVTAEGNRWSVGPLGATLYDGMAGIALFYAYLGAARNERRWTTIAEETMTTLLDVLDSGQPGVAGIGAFSGWSGLVYALTHLGSLWRRDELIDRAESMVSLISPQVPGDCEFDVISGSAGCLAVMLGLHAVRPSDDVLAVARHCGARLIDGACRSQGVATWTSSGVASRPLTGFSHGAAGISWALDRLARATGDSQFRTLAHEGLAFERSEFCAEQQNWPDYREFPETNAESAATRCVVTWCHGAPGIGLARLQMLPHCDFAEDRAALRREIDAALNTTMLDGFGFNHCLCHGDLGNLELLLEASQVLGDAAWNRRATRIAASAVQRAAVSGWRCGIPLAATNAGLMTGLAGIGYQLLRLERPAELPSFLTLDPCSSQ